MAVAEALAHGLPVLTTTGAPWSVVVERGCGWWVEPSVTGLESGLRQATALGRPQLEAMGANGRRLIAERFSWEVVARDMTALYEDLVAGKGGITR
jgi:glycosyltransferase involved in cell wall biosynthesis